jgi:hypothetical protein
MAVTVATADSITPSSQSWTADPGDVLTFTKEVTISASSGTKLDVFFLFDTSGSMTGLVQQAQNIVSQLVYGDSIPDDTGADGLADIYTDLAIGVGHYQDVPVKPFGWPLGEYPPDDTYQDQPWILAQGLTTTLASGVAAINALPTTNPAPPSLDVAESQLYALMMAATDPLVGWRDDAARILVWVGDEPGWAGPYTDATGAGEGDFYPTAYATTVSDAISALSAAGIIVEAVSAGSGNGLDGTWTVTSSTTGFEDLVIDITLGPGQASAITGATGGDLSDLGAATDAELLAAILAAVESGFEQYSSVGLDLADAIAEGISDIKYKQSTLDWGDDDNAPYTGMWTREEERTFLFDVQLTVPGVDNIQYVFNIFGTLDEGRIVAELDTITVGDPPRPEIPEPSTVALLGLGLLGVGFAARRKLRK